MKFLNLIVDHARATLSIMLLVLFAGTMARIALPVEVNPNVTLPLVMIMVRHDGISPEDGTRLLIRPVEKELKTLDGLEEINAVAREGAIYIMTEFDISEDIDKVVSEVREAVDRAKAEFPQDTKEPIVNELSPSPEPTVVITFSGEQASEREIFRTAKFFQRKLEMLPNVLKADISGHRDEVVEAVLDPYRLEQYNITADEMLRSVLGNNLLIPAGEIDAAQGRFGIKVPALIETTDDIRKLPVRFTADGVITLGDVADDAHLKTQAVLVLSMVRRQSPLMYANGSMPMPFRRLPMCAPLWRAIRGSSHKISILNIFLTALNMRNQWSVSYRAIFSLPCL